MRTVAAHWGTYNAAVLPKDAGDVQRTECQLAFYAGAQAVLTIMATMPQDVSDDAGVAIIEGLHAECRRFAVEYGKSKGLPAGIAEAVDAFCYGNRPK